MPQYFSAVICHTGTFRYNERTLKNRFRNSINHAVLSILIPLSLNAANAADLKTALSKVIAPKCAATVVSRMSAVKPNRWIWRQDLVIEGAVQWTGLDTESLAWATLTPNGSDQAQIEIFVGTEKYKIQISSSPCDLKEPSGLKEAFATQASLSQKPKIYYSWSTGMILSLEGMRDVVKLADESSAELVLLSDPKLDERSLESWKEKIKLETGTAKVSWQRLENQGLMARGIRLQYPSILLESNGRIQATAYPGHKPLAVWQTWLKTSERALAKGPEGK